MPRGLELTIEGRDTLSSKLKSVDRNVKHTERNMVQSSQKMARGFNRVAQSAQRMERFVGRAATGAKFALAGMAVATTLVGANFDEKMANVAAVAGANDRQFSQLTATAREWGAKTAFSATQVAEAEYSLVSAGQSVVQVQQSVGGVLKFAGAAATDLGSAAELVTSNLSAFNLQAKDTDRITNAMAASISASRMNAERLQASLAPVAGAANAVGMSIESTLAPLALLVNGGMEASVAGTSLRGVLLKLLNPGNELKDVLGGVTLQADGLVGVIRRLQEQNVDETALTRMFDARTVVAVMQLMNQGADAMGKMQDRLTGTTTAADAYNRQMKAISNQFDTFKSGMEETMIASFMALRDEQMAVVKSAQEMAEKYRPWIVGLVVTTVDWVKANGPLIIQFGEMAGKALLASIAIGLVLRVARTLIGIYNVLAGVTTIATGAMRLGWNLTKLQIIMTQKAFVATKLIMTTGFLAIKGAAETLYLRMLYLPNSVNLLKVRFGLMKTSMIAGFGLIKSAAETVYLRFLMLPGPIQLTKNVFIGMQTVVIAGLANIRSALDTLFLRILIGFAAMKAAIVGALETLYLRFLIAGTAIRGALVGAFAAIRVAALWAFRALVGANPWVLIITALIGIGVLLYKTSDRFREFAKDVGRIFVNLGKDIWDGIKWPFEKIGELAKKAGGIFKKIFPDAEKEVAGIQELVNTGAPKVELFVGPPEPTKWERFVEYIKNSAKSARGAILGISGNMMGSFDADMKEMMKGFDEWNAKILATGRTELAAQTPAATPKTGISRGVIPDIGMFKAAEQMAEYAKAKAAAEAFEADRIAAMQLVSENGIASTREWLSARTELINIHYDEEISKVGATSQQAKALEMMRSQELMEAKMQYQDTYMEHWMATHQAQMLAMDTLGTAFDTWIDDAINGELHLKKTRERMWTNMQRRWIEISANMAKAFVVNQIKAILLSDAAHKKSVLARKYDEAKIGAVKAYQAFAGIPFVGPVLGAAAAAAAFAFLMAFHNGGKIKGQGETVVRVLGGEYVTRTASVNPQTQPTLEYINQYGRLPSRPQNTSTPGYSGSVAVDNRRTIELHYHGNDEREKRSLEELFEDEIVPLIEGKIGDGRLILGTS